MPACIVQLAFKVAFKVVSFQHNLREFLAVARTTCVTSEAQPTNNHPPQLSSKQCRNILVLCTSFHNKT